MATITEKKFKIKKEIDKLLPEMVKEIWNFMEFLIVLF